MSEQVIKDAIANSTMRCPKCKKPIQKYEKYMDTIDAVRDGFNVVEVDSRSSRVTLTCGNGDCDWRERTEYWSELID
ncbi:MAG TPA: hypothetical protein EYN91_12385 [Candidatus Melainabacteria bacterium]|jgi:hypothetical protein|nr:hypothetical protein [Candidatus Melainabacteria bacterium]HIN63681.1 hypothetical protein [Candidatus Obscuribacterales bacterium]